MKGLILAGLVAMTTVLGVAGKGEALPVSVPCSVALTAQGQEANPYNGDCAVGIASDIVTVSFFDFTIVWRDRQEFQSTTMGLFENGQDGTALLNAMAKNDEQGVTCAAGTMNTRRQEILSVCFSRTAYNGLSELSQNDQ